MAEQQVDSECCGIGEFLNITAGEYQDAKVWLLTLKRVEQARVRATLRLINGIGAPITTIVAGSSVYSGQIPMKRVEIGSGPTPSYLWQPDQSEIAKGRGHYRSIDLFVMCNPAEALGQLLKKRGESVHVPSHVYYTSGGEARRRVFDLGMNQAEAAYDQEVSGAANVPVVISPLRDSAPSRRSFVLSRNYRP